MGAALVFVNIFYLGVVSYLSRLSSIHPILSEYNLDMIVIVDVIDSRFYVFSNLHESGMECSIIELQHAAFSVSPYIYVSIFKLQITAN